MSGSRVWEISECEVLTNFIEGFFELLQLVPGNLHETMRHCGFGSVYLKETETHARVHTHVRHHHECKCLQKKQTFKKLLKKRRKMLVQTLRRLLNGYSINNAQCTLFSYFFPPAVARLIMMNDGHLHVFSKEWQRSWATSTTNFYSGINCGDLNELNLINKTNKAMNPDLSTIRKCQVVHWNLSRVSCCHLRLQ